MIKDVEEIRLEAEGHFLIQRRHLPGRKIGPPLEWTTERIAAGGAESRFECIADLSPVHRGAWWHAILARRERGYVKGVRIDERFVDVETCRALECGLLLQ